MDNLDYKTELDKIFDHIGENKLVALATSSQNVPTVRTISVIVHDKKLYFQTGIDLVKYKQIAENNNVALCFDNIQIEGIANIIGKPNENTKIMEIYKRHYKMPSVFMDMRETAPEGNRFSDPLLIGKGPVGGGSGDGDVSGIPAVGRRRVL